MSDPPTSLSLQTDRSLVVVPAGVLRVLLEMYTTGSQRRAHYIPSGTREKDHGWTTPSRVGANLVTTRPRRYPIAPTDTVAETDNEETSHMTEATNVGSCATGVDGGIG